MVKTIKTISVDIEVWEKAAEILRAKKIKMSPYIQSLLSNLVKRGVKK